MMTWLKRKLSPEKEVDSTNTTTQPRSDILQILLYIPACVILAMIRTSIMDSDCGLSPKINLNVIVYIVSVVSTIYGTHNIILQVIIITYHISLYNSSNKKTWDILLPIHN